jgi:hypothetical protein
MAQPMFGVFEDVRTSLIHESVPGFGEIRNTPNSLQIRGTPRCLAQSAA